MTMGLISDANGKPMTTETEAKEEAKPGQNGQSHGPEVQDVRGLPTGTLFYNLIRVVGEEVGIEGFIHQMEAAKISKKMVTDPPQLVRAKEVYAQMCERRFIFANELNQRFKDIDEARAKACGITVFVPKAAATPDEDEKPSVAEHEAGSDAS
jgi:hypothetical protein